MSESPAPEAPKSYRLPKDRLHVLDALIADLAKKAAKCGVPAPGYRITAEITERRASREIRDPDDSRGYRVLAPGEEAHSSERVKIVLLVDVEPIGEAPRINGWRLAARLEHSPAGNVIFKNRLVPEELPLSYRSCAASCDHCNLKRSRANTYVLVSDDGAHKLVGSACLADFLGHASPEAMILAAGWIERLCEVCADEEEGGYGAGGGRSYEDLPRVLEIAAACIRLDGWVSRAREEASYGKLPATASEVSSVLYSKRSYLTPEHRKYLEDREGRGDEDKATAAAALEWAKALPVDGSEYESNLRIIAHNGYVDGGRLGMAVSIVSAHHRALGNLHEAGRSKSKLESLHVGEVGTRPAMTLYVERVIVLYSEMYGNSYLHLMHDADENALKWKASAAPLEAGKWYRGKVSVKAHEEWAPKDAPERKVKTTVLARCALEECAADAPAEDPKPPKAPRKARAKKGAAPAPEAEAAPVVAPAPAAEPEEAVSGWAEDHDEPTASMVARGISGWRLD